jgi:hypothetical protein
VVSVAQALRPSAQAPPCLVMMLTTPPMASAPYWAECAPLATSMRSIEASGMLKMEVVPLVAELARTPLINTSVWVADMPRR